MDIKGNYLKYYSKYIRIYMFLKHKITNNNYLKLKLTLKP
jgi:hypothetical protein